MKIIPSGYVVVIKEDGLHRLVKERKLKRIYEDIEMVPFERISFSFSYTSQIKKS